MKIKIYKTIILPVVLYGCETWSLTLREESRLRVFENRMLRRIFGPNMNDNGEWRRLHNEKLNSLYRSPNIVKVIRSRRLRLLGHVATMKEERRALNILTCIPAEKRSLGRNRCTWEDKIRMDIKEIGINTRNWLHSAQDRDYWKALVNAALNLRVP